VKSDTSSRPVFDQPRAQMRIELRKSKSHSALLSVLGLTLGIAIGFAVPLCQSGAARADEFQNCLADLRAQARAHGISEATLAKTVDGLRYDPEILPLLTNQPEFKTPVWDYLASLVDQERVDDGRGMLQHNSRTFAVAEQRFGVDRAVIAAVWGVESDFGRSFGTRPVIKSLATLSCAGPRQKYFRSELLAAVKIVDRGDIEPSQFNGSWAGAFGHTQFMPSTFLTTAVDLDGDGRRDLINSIPDAIGSTAAYLHKHGWTPGLDWGFEVSLPAHYAGPSGRTRKEPMSVWAARGLRRIDGAPIAGSAHAGLLLPAGPNGPAFLVTRNFDAIYSYNAAESYALAIALLSNRLRGRPGLVAAWPTDDPGLSRAERRELQTLLIRRGYDLDGKADGVIGTKSRQAISDFQQRQGLPANGRAGAKVLSALRQ